jgi:DNA gyrase subunit A
MEIPYQVNKSDLIEKIADLVKNKVIEGISNIRDESSRMGIRVVIDIKKGEIAKVIINQLFKHTQLESSVSIILLAILDNRPTIFSLREMLEQFLIFRKEVLRRRTTFNLEKCRAREHVLLGLVTAINNIDDAVQIIKLSKGYDEASIALQERFAFSQIQAKAVLDMRLNKITTLEATSLLEEIESLKIEITFFESLLSSPELLKQEIIKELSDIKARYGDKRRTAIDTSEEVITDIDLVPNEEVVVTLTKKGYIKRVKMENYSVQHRGGRGKKGIADLGEHDDVILDVFVGKNHDTLLFFTNKGRVYSTRTFEIPEGSRIARGRAIVNLLPLGVDEKIIKLLGTSDLVDKFLVMVTIKGVIKKTASESFEKIRSTGIIALDLRDGDELAFCALSSGNDNIILAASNGYGIRFNEEEVRAMGRQAAGVRGISLRKNAEVVGLEVVPSGMDDVQLLFATSLGFGKQVSVGDFRVAHRAGMGVRTIPADKRNGDAIGMVKVNEKSNILLIDNGGKIIRLNPDEIRVMRRGAKGVRLIKLDLDKKLTSVVAFDEEEASLDIKNETNDSGFEDSIENLDPLVEQSDDDIVVEDDLDDQEDQSE